jgi:uncharacterized membrane protein
MKTVIGVFSTREEADRAVRSLEKEGYSAEDMSIVVKDKEQVGGTEDDQDHRLADNTSAGAVAGGAVGGLAGLLIGIGALAIPGIGGLLIAGPIAAALGLTGAAATTVSGALTGALAGGLIGALTSLGIPEREARYYEEKVREGAVLLLVNVATEGDVSNVENIYEHFSAEQVRVMEFTPA